MTTDSRGWLLLALLAGAGWLIYLLAPVITPFAISAVLAYFGDPLVDRRCHPAGAGPPGRSRYYDLPHDVTEGMDARGISPCSEPPPGTEARGRFGTRAGPSFTNR